MRFWNFRNEADSEDIELRIAGEIVDDDSAWIYEWFGIAAASPNAFREELNQYADKNLTVWIDSWGGDVTAAAGIYNALKEHKGKVTVKIDGKAVSAASVIAMAGDEVLMSPVGVLMIHNPWTGVSGEAKDLRHVADVLDVIKDTIMNAYQLKTGKSRSKISQMMDNETWMSAKTAKSERFIDDILYSGKEDTDQPVENSFMLSHMAIQNSATASMRNFIEEYRKNLQNNKEGTELAIDSIEDLQREKPDLVNQVVQDAVKAERERIIALDALDDPQNPAIHDLIEDAKKTGKTAAEIQTVVDIVKKHSSDITAAAENKAGQQFFNAVITDNKASGVDDAKATGTSSKVDDKQKDAMAISFMASVINKKNGRVSK
ncbi:head maturation protease, ClpP-related [Sporomusa acidovorans]|uniref:ATP-dependent Clp protease proteolytic subunit n=1 Tax=Sporomusa acidovorans (strain ATCC 49682 / DSM 3132 / Mol) TaxID=1123286 RepID=A0ABZ3J922_SPOA4|nr:head maturation protease, ClpP-related [Sporomusa acidovorans]OZC16021.1 ATP-dependent Clp protease proteolytic subunit [Sporomusa acidovorans DSM 3132]SDD89388.1 ATP-dependent Clp endopeptidase, proteolytic subunit ClpP [Sporomusa acidovorans]